MVSSKRGLTTNKNRAILLRVPEETDRFPKWHTDQPRTPESLLQWLRSHKELMALSSKTIQSLCKVITPEVIEEIFSSDAYVEFMMNSIPNAIQEKMGPLDDELLGELSFMVFDNISIVPASKVSQWESYTHKNQCILMMFWRISNDRI